MLSVRGLLRMSRLCAVLRVRGLLRMSHLRTVLRLLLRVCGLLGLRGLLLRVRRLLRLLLRVCSLLGLLLRVSGLLRLLLSVCGLLCLSGLLRLLLRVGGLLLRVCGLLRLLLRVGGLLLSVRGLLGLRGLLCLLLGVCGLLRLRGLLLSMCGLLRLLLSECSLLLGVRGLPTVLRREAIRGLRAVLGREAVRRMRGLSAMLRVLGREAIRGMRGLRAVLRREAIHGGRRPCVSEESGDLGRRLRLGLDGTLVEDPRLQDEWTAQHLIHGADLTGRDLVTVDEDAAGAAARVLDRGAPVLEVQQRMARRHGRVVQPQVRRRIGAERVGAGDEDLRPHQEAVAEDDDLQDAGLAAQR
ncbi:hypothetical protein ASNO1_06380 [Corallococcus caeni]|uniref:Uncharacterized protein n=1 Tax=Corallococcus caeni TaxID=3082388 RepID=A0ABQ6QKK8_9BACT|nr:hypothetical protein ASNO1_06380 [Corallococcus sp. NO1]